MNNKINNARVKIDYAIDGWLKAQGLTNEQVNEINFSYIDDELQSLLTMTEV